MNERARGRWSRYSNRFSEPSNLSWLYPDARSFYNNNITGISPSYVIRDPLEYRICNRSIYPHIYTVPERNTYHTTCNLEQNKTPCVNNTKDSVTTESQSVNNSSQNHESCIRNSNLSEPEYFYNIKSVIVTKPSCLSESSSHTVTTSDIEQNETLCDGNTFYSLSVKATNDSCSNDTCITNESHIATVSTCNTEYENEKPKISLLCKSNTVTSISSITKKPKKIIVKRIMKMKNYSAPSAKYRTFLAKEVNKLHKAVKGVTNTFSFLMSTVHAIHEIVNELKEQQISTEKSVIKIQKSLLYINETLIAHSEDMQQVMSSSLDDLAESICSQFRPVIVHSTEIKNRFESVTESVNNVSDAIKNLKLTVSLNPLHSLQP